MADERHIFSNDIHVDDTDFETDNVLTMNPISVNSIPLGAFSIAESYPSVSCRRFGLSM